MVPFLRRSPRPLSASSLRFKPRMPIHSPGTKVPRYTGIRKYFSRIYSEQGAAAFWRVNFTNCIRYFPTQAFNLSLKDSIKIMFPKYGPKQDFGMFFSVNMASGGLAAAGNLTIVYPLDYARKRLSSDVGSGNQTFDGLFVCLEKTAAGPKSFCPCTLVFACPSEESSRTVASSSVPSTPSWDSTCERTTQACITSPPRLWQHRQPWRLQVQAESQLFNTSTRAQLIA